MIHDTRPVEKNDSLQWYLLRQVVFVALLDLWSKLWPGARDDQPSQVYIPLSGLEPRWGVTETMCTHYVRSLRTDKWRAKRGETPKPSQTESNNNPKERKERKAKEAPWGDIAVNGPNRLPPPAVRECGRWRWSQKGGLGNPASAASMIRVKRI